MKSEPLSIGDKKFLVNRLIQQAPSGTMIREFFKNAEENAALAPEGNRRIEIYPVTVEGVSKLAFWNTGVGMNAEELKRATDLSSSINKEMSLDGNFGIGAKVSGLTVSSEGIRYRSCKKGRVHEVVIGYDEDEETYVRFLTELPDGTTDTVYDVTNTVELEGHSTDYDWTEVVLLGQASEHDTVVEPLKMGSPVDRSYVPTTIFRRFSEFADGVEVKIDVAMTKGGGKNETGRFRSLRTLNQILPQLANHELVVEPSSGVAVRYIHDPKHEKSSHTLSARANPATGSTTFCAIVFKGERYDYKSSKGWSSIAPNFGIPFGSRVLTVEVLVPDDMALPNQYRDNLTWPEDRSQMSISDFSDFVRELMPDWVKEVIKSESPEASDNLDDLQKDLQKLLDEFRVPTTVRKITQADTAEHSERQDTGEDSSEPSDVVLDEVNDEDGNGENTKDGKAGYRARNKKIRKAPDGAQASEASKALERVPEIKILTDLEEISEKSLTGRAGRYYKDTQILFINGHYPVVERMARDLEAELADMDEDSEVVREVTLRASRRSMAFRVGKSTCYAISKRMSEDWSSEDLEKATAPEALSMAADDYKQSLTEAKKYARKEVLAENIRSEEAA